MMHLSFNQKFSAVVLSGSLLLAVAIVLGLACGSNGIDLIALKQTLLGQSTPTSTSIFLKIRLPRVILAAHAGAVLSLGGLVFQAILRNPLAEPYILGISGGAAVGTIIGILTGLSSIFIGGATFAGGLSALAFITALGLVRRGGNSLLLSGVMVNAFCSAIVLFLLSQAQSSEVSAIMYWFMGDLGAGNLNEAILLSYLLIPGYIIILLATHRLNLLLLGEDAARSLGINIQLFVLILLIVISIMVSGTVAIVGPLGFVGIVVPQALRLRIGADHRLLAPACILFGASYMIGCDVLARISTSQGELPAGVITALVGAPLFIFFLRRNTCA